MKELTIQQKAEAYDKVIERAKLWRNAPNTDKIPTFADKVFADRVIEEIFPELKESEDEKIKNILIGYFNKYKEHEECGIKTFYGIPTDNIITWLEKKSNTNETINRDEFAQGVLRGAAINLITWIDYNSAEGNMCLSNMECEDIENALVHADWNKIYAYLKKKLEKQDEQKPVDKVEPKFKVGDWIIKNDDSLINIDYSCCKITKVENGNYTIESIGGYKGYNTFDTFEKDYHLWTIQDAKNNDILVSDNNLPFIFDGTFNEYGVGAHGGINVVKQFKTCTIEGSWTSPKGIKPATKEQQDLLFSKMKEAGYKLDEKFNLIKI